MTRPLPPCFTTTCAKYSYAWVSVVVIGPDAEDEADMQQQTEDEEETPAPEPKQASLDIDSLEEPPTGGAGGNPDGEIVSNPFSSSGNDEGDGGGHASRGEEASLREGLHALAEELQRRKRDREGEEDAAGEGLEGSRELWGRLRNVTGSLSQRLCEQLRLVLEPMVATKLQGDYRSGKRINMRRVIPYIASGFRKDKIWLRRTKPAKRDYQVRVRVVVGLLRFGDWLRYTNSRSVSVCFLSIVFAEVGSVHHVKVIPCSVYSFSRFSLMLSWLDLCFCWCCLLSADDDNT